MPAGKPSGLKTARKLRDHRRTQRWSDKAYKKLILEQDGKRIPSRVPHTQRVLYLKRLVLKLNNRILPFVNV
uniref:30S ribosomal protein S4 n=1 Tax=Schistosoma mansoni TaxID=6183 RepID=A0A5K4FG77_SCHMA